MTEENQSSNVLKLNDQYFESYEDIAVHRLMLLDEPRTLAYKRAIWENRSAFKDKVVLDVGSGTGILSVFCAKAGAKRVHAVEASRLALLSKEVVKENKLGEIITIHQTAVESLELPEQVDIIVSEWMGFFLLHEGMLDSVIRARNRFLKPGGLMFPESADLWVSPCQVPSFFSFWDNVYDVKMSAVGRHHRRLIHAPEVLTVAESDLLGEESVVVSLPLNTVTHDDIRKICFQTVVPAVKRGFFQGLSLWFVCNFPSVADEGNYLCLTTRPGEPETHWKQTVIVLPHEIEVDEGDPIAFELELRREELDERKYQITMTMLDPEQVQHPTPCSCSRIKCVIIKKYIEDQANNGGACLEDDEEGED